MRRHHILKSGLVVSILLLSGVIVVPANTINSAVVSADNEYFNVTVTVFGMQHFNEKSVKLTKHQYQQMNQYLTHLKERLNQTESWNETTRIFHEAVDELNFYRLLPDGATVEQVRRLVSGKQDNLLGRPMIPQWFERMTKNRTGQSFYQDTKNSLCLLSATLRRLPDTTPAPYIIPLGALLVFGLSPAILLSIFGAEELAKQLIDIELFLWSLNPFRLFNFVLFMGYEVSLFTVGLRGLDLSNYEGGGLFTGFTGLMLNPFGDTAFFLGFALRVDGTV